MPNLSPRTASRLYLLATVAMLVTIATTVIAPSGADAHSIEKWWQYDKAFWGHSWESHDTLKGVHDDWHKDQKTLSEGEEANFHHDTLAHRHRKIHYHTALEKQSGNASWYDAEGQSGACGTTLTGYYVAHPSWPCGALVSIKRGDAYVMARVRDRGPYSGGRIIDLSKAAFDALGDLGSGVMYVDAFHLAE